MSNLEQNTDLEDVTDSIEVGPTFPEVQNDGDDANIPDVQDDDGEDDDDADGDDEDGEDEDDEDEDDDGDDDDDDDDEDNDGDAGDASDDADDAVDVNEIVPELLVNVAEDDDTEDEDEDYLQKLDKEVRENFLADYHPESLSHNYEEVKNLAKVTRNKDGQDRKSVV